MKFCGLRLLQSTKKIELMVSQSVDPNEFIITRKRKKYKFAKFLNSPICYELDDWQKQAIDVVEIGAGTGLFSVELAQRYPGKQFLAVDVKADRLQKGAYLAAEYGLENIRFLRARADQLSEVIDSASLGSIWLTFPDPFLKSRSSGRRLTHSRFLQIYQSLLKKDGTLCLKHDNQEFFHWSLEQLVSQNWCIKQLSFDLHQSGLPDDYKIVTTYERRWSDEGLSINFVKAQVGRVGDHE